MSDREEPKAPTRGAARSGASAARRRPARSADKGKKSPVALIALGATVVVIGVVAFFLLQNDDSGKKDDTQQKAEQSAAPVKKDTSSIFDADNIKKDEGAGAGERSRVTGREPVTLDLKKMEEHLDRLYVSDELRASMKALKADVLQFQKERWDVDQAMKDRLKKIMDEVDVAKRDPFLAPADDALRGFNTFTEKREVHLRDENDNLLPQPFIGIPMEPYLFIVQASKEGGEKEIAVKIHGWLAQLRDFFIDYFTGTVELKPNDRFKLITVVLFRKMKDYQAYNRIKDPERDKTFALAHYEPDNHRLCVPLEFGMASAGEDPEHMLREVMFHEATHQLMHYYTKTNHLGAFGSMWSDEGVAEYFAGHGDEGGKFVFGRINSRMSAVAADNKDMKRRIPFIQLLKWTRFLHSQEEEKGGQAQAEADRVHAHVYSQGWALVYFMNNFQNGKYKRQFLAIMKRQIGEKGDYGLPVFTDIFDDAAFSQIEVEFNDYQDAMTDAWRSKELKVGDAFLR